AASLPIDFVSPSFAAPDLEPFDCNLGVRGLRIQPLQQAHGDGPQGLQKNGNILERRAMQNVLQVVPGFVLRGVVLAQAMDLGEPGDSGLYAESFLIPVAVVAGALGSLGPGPDEAHLAAQDVDEV